jgi:hypothetical protein
MFRAGLSAILMLASLGILGATEFNWGIKYGIGNSSLHGSDKAYELRYDIFEHTATAMNPGYVVIRSKENSGGFSQNAGAYASILLARKTDSVRLNTELLWQRFVYNHEFKEAIPGSSSLILAQSFGDTLRGRIEGSADYITIPLLISLHQELSEEKKLQHYQGAFVYLGPSVSFLVNQERAAFGGIAALDKQVESFVQDSLNDADPATYYSAQRQKVGSDAFVSTKTDLVIGVGFTLKDILQFGIGKDEFVFDFRYTIGMNDLGDSGIRDAFTLRSIMLSVGCRL